jgi:hypothetical protein
MDIFQSGFFAQIFYLGDNIAKTSPWVHFRGILGNFLVLGRFSKFYIFFKLKKKNV